MKRLIILVLNLACSCNQNKPKHPSALEARAVPKVFRLNTDPSFRVDKDVVFWKKTPYSGFVYQLDSLTKDTLFIEGYSAGLLNGLSKKWYPNRQLMEERYYAQGKKQGRQVAYWENGQKRFEFTAINDAYEGELKEWSHEGLLFHLAHYSDGQEEGVQKLWYDNGKIRANYVMIKGKRFGLLGTKNCKNVSDSIFVVQ